MHIVIFIMYFNVIHNLFAFRRLTRMDKILMKGEKLNSKKEKKSKKQKKDKKRTSDYNSDSSD